MQYLYEFNQEKILKVAANQINMNDILILHYILNALCSNKMQKKYENNKIWVWIDRKHLLDSLPILGISENRLCVIIKKLKDLKLIESLNIANGKNKGTKSYITFTDKLIECLTEKHIEYYKEKIDQFVKKQTENRPVCKKTNSDNSLTNNSNTIIIDNNKLLSNNNSFFGSIKKSKSKKMTYKDCIDLINNYTDDLELRKCLTDYLKLRLVMKDKPMRLTQWEYILNDLTKCIKESNVSAVEIVKNSIIKGYPKFYAVTNYNNKKQPPTIDLSLEGDSTQDTEEERIAHQKWLKEMEAKGEQMLF